ncbi:MAG: hypothetical protein U0893_02670 [Chloroflexota bacterium]
MPKKPSKKPADAAPTPPPASKSPPAQTPKSVPLLPPVRKGSSVWDAYPIPGLTPTPKVTAASRDNAPAARKGQPFKTAATKTAQAHPGASKVESKTGAKSGTVQAPGVRKDLSKRQVDAIREFALALANQMIDPDAVMICNPVTEPAALPLEELLYDRCRWCEVDIYYDRLMPAPLGLVRVCIACGVMLLEAEKKGKN